MSFTERTVLASTRQGKARSRVLFGTVESWHPHHPVLPNHRLPTAFFPSPPAACQPHSPRASHPFDILSLMTLDQHIPGNLASFCRFPKKSPTPAPKKYLMRHILLNERFPGDFSRPSSPIASTMYRHVGLSSVTIRVSENYVGFPLDKLQLAS